MNRRHFQEDGSSQVAPGRRRTYARTEVGVVILSICLGLFLWLGDAFVDSLFFSKKPFLEILLLDVSTYEIYMRTTIFLALVLVGVVAAVLMRRERTARRRLEANEARFEAFMDNLPGIAFIRDSDGRYLFVNDGLCRAVGRSGEDILGKRPDNILQPAEAAKVLAEDVSVLGGNRTYHGESVIRTVDGERTWLASKFPIPGPDGVPAWVGGVSVDITDLKKAEEALRESEERYRTILDDMEEGYYEVDLNGTITFANEALGRTWGIDREDLVGRNFRTIMSEETADRAYAAFNRVFRTGRSEWVPDWQTVRADGTVRALEASAYPISVSEGRYSGFRGVIRDVTQRLAAEKALRESEERYRDLVEHSVDIILTHDMEGRITACNPATVRFFGLESPRDAVGLNLRDVIAAGVKEQFGGYLEAVRRDGRARGYMRVLTRSGEEKVLAYDNTLKIRGGGDAEVRARAQDVTERLAMEKALRESEERYRMLYERNLAGVYRSTLDGRMLECNPACARLLGFESPEDAAGQPTEPLYQDPEARRRLAEELRQVGSVSNFDVALRRRDGRQFRALINATLTRDSDAGEVIEGVLLDVTEKAALAEEKARAHEFQSIAQLTSGIAHEVRNPLFAIQLNFASVMRSLSIDDKTRTQMEYVLSHMKRLESLVRNLLELGQAVQADELSDMDLGALLRTACIVVEEEFPPKAGRIDLHAGTDPVRVRVSPRKITQAFVHLIRNATQVTPEGGTVHIKCSHDASGCLVSISDQGTGVPDKVRDSLFEPFVTTRTGQPGMGLALARHYIESHGGKIEFEDNDPPPGVTFAVWLPRDGMADGSGPGVLPMTG